jgi:hypothetical protein
MCTDGRRSHRSVRRWYRRSVDEAASRSRLGLLGLLCRQLQKGRSASVSCPSLSLSHSLARPAVGTYCPAQYTIHPALFLAKLHNMYNGVRRNLELVRVQNLLNVDNVAKLNPTKRP